MKPNVNNLATLQSIRESLREKGVSEATVATLTNAVKSGMVIKKPKDIGLLSIPAPEAELIATSVSFGPSQPEPQEFKTVQFTFTPVGTGNVDDIFHGYQLLITYTNKERYTTEETYPIEDSRIVIVDIDLNDILDNSKISLQAKTSNGEYTKLSFVADTTVEPFQDSLAVSKSDLKNAEIAVAVVRQVQVLDPQFYDSYQIKGKLLPGSGDFNVEDYQIIIFAATDLLPGSSPEYLPVAYAKTETHGYFLTSFLSFPHPEDLTRVKVAKALVAKDDYKTELPIKLMETTTGDDATTIPKSMLPRRLILVLHRDREHTEDSDCKCDGCNDLNFHQKKVFEEYTYHTVVRTTEPAILADVIEEEDEIDLSEIYGDSASGIRVSKSVFQKFHAIKNRQSASILYAKDTPVPSNAVMARALTTGNLSAEIPASALPPARPARPTIFGDFDKSLLDRLAAEEKADHAADPNRKRIHKGRTRLTPLNQINWDKATVYQAATIAHGHLLHFKQQWIPDGYSIGDLLYSLPLAPGQKKQIAVLDWERRESAANSQELDYEEYLNNSLVRDRDISEIVTATLDENISGRSTAKTSGIAGGHGAAAMGIIKGIAFGSVLGISGGISKSTSNASQTSHRESTANSLQSIHDRTRQAAAAVRSQRSTVIQTVSQGERVQATSESIANYNHCHAITIQYFEVLRHFAISNRFAGAQECLFVPLQISNFDIEKALRWRNTLERRLRVPRLGRAFESLERIQNERESAAENYYDNIGFPRRHFAEEQILNFQGELFMEFYFFNTKDSVDDALIQFFKKFFKIDLNEYKDRKLTDAELSRIVGPRTIELLLDAVVIETQTGQSLNVDVTLLTPFRQNARLQISLRQSGPISIAREVITSVRIRIDENKVRAEDATDIKQFSEKYMKILVRSGTLRYTTRSFSETLFNTRIDNDLFIGTDSIYIPTPLNGFELRNPRGEDVDAANNLIHHLNENLEYYHKCIWFDMTPERRYMLLDGIVASGKANGRSVASVVENRIIGVAGNSLIMPVAPGFQLDPTLDDTIDLYARYYNEDDEPARVSLPTKGVYAEAVIGKCNSCEEKDEARFWRWEESPIPDSPNTQINPISMDTRRVEPGDLQPKDFPAPVINVQNAPALPDPTGLNSILTLLGKSDLFSDVTGLTENQKNALAAFQSSLQAAQSFGKEAADLAKTASMLNVIKDAKKSGTISNEQAKEKAAKVLDQGIDPQDPAIEKLNKGLETIDKFQKDGVLSAETAEQAKQGLLTRFLDSSVHKTPISNAEITKLSETAKNNNTDISVARPDGEKVEIKGPGSTGIGGNTITRTINLPNSANHEGYSGQMEFRFTLEQNGDFKVELINNSFDHIDAGPLHATNENNAVLKSDSPQYGDIVPCNPRSTTLLYEGRLRPNSAAGDFIPRTSGPDPFAITVGIKTSMTKSDLKYCLPFAANLRIACTQGQNIGTHTGGSKFSLDFGVPRGTRVHAAMNGTVVDIVRVHPNRPIGNRGSSDNDNIVRIRHDDLSYAIYGHLNQNAINVSVGHKVSIGQLLGHSGNSGASSGDHLHFAIEKATMNDFESIEFALHDKNGASYLPTTGKIFELNTGLVSGKYSDGQGDPNGNVPGDIGDVFARTDGSPGNLFYVKETGGAGTNTGWVAKAALS